MASSSLSVSCFCTIQAKREVPKETGSVRVCVNEGIENIGTRGEAGVHARLSFSAVDQEIKERRK